MIIFLKFLFANPSIGKIPEKSSLSHQTLMELLIEKADNKHLACRNAENPADVIGWFGVVCNDQHKVINVYWGYTAVGGSIQLEWLPETVREAFLNDGTYTGTVNLTELARPRQAFWYCELRETSKYPRVSSTGQERILW
mmetsp:Transcript_468/g.798  ORF Transcript_468/g.798 Transcript_468/m.798 type:complete len:140 (-) Transcript_468:121-540(-)